MELDAQLVDITLYLGPLRFVFFKMAFQLRQSLGRRGGSVGTGTVVGSATALTLQSHARGRSVHYERAPAMLALKKDVALSILGGGGSGLALHWGFSSNPHTSSQGCHDVAKMARQPSRIATGWRANGKSRKMVESYYIHIINGL